jgi:hypothetical protein
MTNLIGVLLLSSVVMLFIISATVIYLDFKKSNDKYS